MTYAGWGSDRCELSYRMRDTITLLDPAVLSKTYSDAVKRGGMVDILPQLGLKPGENPNSWTQA